MRTIKRTGEIVDFNKQKIEIAISKALHATNTTADASIIATAVINAIINDPVTIEIIQDLVEKELMARGLYDTAKAYILYRARHDEAREHVSRTDVSQDMSSFDNDTMREFVYMRTYSRWIPDKNRREMWSETVDRYISYMKETTKLPDSVYEEVRDSIYKQEVMPSMRLLQFAGPAARRCHVCVYNCSYTAPETFKDLVDIMYISMSGTGVGFSVESKHVNKFPVIKERTGIVHTYTIQDSKEGWCDAFEFGLQSWYKGDDVKFDYSLLRPAGARLKIMGGRSSGPQPLMDLFVFTRDLITKNTGSQLSTLNMYDIICKIGQIVVSGGVRRSALINLSDLHDTEIRDAKKGTFWNTNMQRAMANNSAVYTCVPSQVEFIREWLALAESGTGERGIFNRGGLPGVIPARRSAIVDTTNMGLNPCAEVLLQPHQFCNLSEVVCRNTDTEESLMRKIRIATIIGTYQASLTNFSYIDRTWIHTQEMERLLGVSLTGMYDVSPLLGAETLKRLRDYSITVNQEYAALLNINPSTSITLVKPSGTVSQMVNASSGIHPRFAAFYIRRIRISSTDPLLQLMRDQGYPCFPEVGQSAGSANTYVLEFPVKSPPGSITVKDVTALQQLDYWKMVKINYTEHNPSITIYVKENEWLDVGKWVWDNWQYITGLSFLPYTDHIYELAPYEEITEAVYEQLTSKLHRIDFRKLVYYEKSDETDVKREPACVGGVCEL